MSGGKNQTGSLGIEGADLFIRHPNYMNMGAGRCGIESIQGTVCVVSAI